LEATITLEYGDAKTAEAIANAVSPDNFKTPTGLFIKTFRSGNTVVTEIRAKEKFASFIATIDDLLFSASTAEKTIRIAKTK
jgi:tRNA threonylcarbamoyladenosine modification (KEOPS) complex  Pcc1 subunit